MRRPARAAWWVPLLVLAAGCTGGGPPPIVTSEIAQTTVPSVGLNELMIGIDDLGPGFNPHALADVGPVSRGVAGLVLPSPFRQDAAGVLRPDPTLVESAEVTAQQPFTVSYQLRREASWSDGAPIAAEDFAYLAERMRVEPGVAGPAGYRLVSQVVSRSGGKQVDVVFDRPYPGWRTLFANLLPSHLLKDAPGGWTEALEGGIPVSGGPFAMRSIDDVRGLVVLERNDRYWEVPAVLDRLVLREDGAAELVSALATGGDQLAMLRADGIAMNLLDDRAAELPVRTLPEPVVAELLLRPAGPALGDLLVRKAIAAALDVPDLVAVGSGNGPAGELVTAARTLLPSEPGYAPTLPEGLPAMRADADEAAALLGAAGYERAPLPGGSTRWVRDGVPLRLTVAAPSDREEYVTVATRAVRQLAEAGIDAELLTVPGDELFVDLTEPGPAAQATPTSGADGPTPAAPSAPVTAPAPTGQPAEPEPLGVDLAVVPRPTSGDPAADLASWYGCAGTADQDPADADGAGEVGPNVPDDATDDQPTGPVNPAGYCGRALQAAMDDLLTGATSLGEALGPIEAALWRDLPSIPLFQHAVVVVTGRGLEDVEPGNLLSGAFAGADRWRRSAR